MVHKRNICHVVLIVLLAFLLFACQDNDNGQDDPNDEQPVDYDALYDAQLRINHWDELDTIDESGIWLIYYYMRLCPACIYIQDAIFNFVTAHGIRYPVYFGEASAAFTGTPPADIRYVPTMIVMSGSNYIEHIVGADILTLLSQLAGETYQLPDPQIGIDDEVNPGEQLVDFDALYDAQLRINHWDELDTIDESGLWLIYLYSRSCPACILIQEEVFIFVATQDDRHPVYFGEATPDLTSTGTPPADIRYVPTVIVMLGSTYVELIEGAADILTLLSQLSQDTYQMPEGQNGFD
ncbi:MAG: hypothetical protein EA375_03470 [Acholeplasmataceae bacterium]|nr:MAG: hypothetical protein EA375_03470 [Acholeplasmataceae bacterium]